MYIRRLTLIGLCSILILATGYGCSPDVSPTPSQEPAGSSLPALFHDTQREGPVDTSPAVTRFRFAAFNNNVLLDDSGQALTLEVPYKILVNLFPDVTYTGVITQVTQDEGGITWSGYLDGVEYSELLLVYAAGVIMLHAASPAGVYEATSVGDDLYRIVQIDQTQLPGGEGNIDGNSKL